MIILFPRKLAPLITNSCDEEGWQSWPERVKIVSQKYFRRMVSCPSNFLSHYPMLVHLQIALLSCSTGWSTSSWKRATTLENKKKKKNITNLLLKHTTTLVPLIEVHHQVSTFWPLIPTSHQWLKMKRLRWNHDSTDFYRLWLCGPCRVSEASHNNGWSTSRSYRFIQQRSYVGKRCLDMFPPETSS